MQRVGVITVASLAIVSIALAQQTGGPELNIVSPRDGAEVTGPNLQVQLQVRGVELAPQRSRAGAYLLLRFDDKPPVKAYSDQFTFQGVEPGSHLLRVELRRSDDSAFTPPVRQQVRFTVRSSGP